MPISLEVNREQCFGVLGQHAATKIMANRPSLKPTKINWALKSKWKVEIPESLSPIGRRRRYFFSTKEEPELFARQQKSGLRLYGVQGGGILPPMVQGMRSANCLSPEDGDRDTLFACAVLHEPSSSRSPAGQALPRAPLSYARFLPPSRALAATPLGSTPPEASAPGLPGASPDTPVAATPPIGGPSL
jgi:hypothetical protein